MRVAAEEGAVQGGLCGAAGCCGGARHYVLRRPVPTKGPDAGVLFSNQNLYSSDVHPRVTYEGTMPTVDAAHP